jgi:pimeloyl-ACP methyl ester carboxylesterase
MSWILLRGLTREARHWGTFTAWFAGQCGHEEVVALDLPGSGAFYLQTSPVQVHEMVEFLRLQLRVKALPSPYKLLAMSLGGMVATDWAQRYPNEVTRLVLVNTSMRPFSTTAQRLRPANWLQLALLAARWRDANYAERVIHQLTCNHSAPIETDLAAWRQIRKTAPVSAANAARQLLAAARFSCAPTAPACSVLVLSSRADRLVHPQCSAQLAAAWQAKFHQHPWAGHDLPHDDVAWVCETVADWLAEPA